MNQGDEVKAARLVELLNVRGKKGDLLKVLGRCANFAEFRVLMMLDGGAGQSGRDVVEKWRAKLTRVVDGNDGNKVLHELELVSMRQMELERLLRANEAALMERLRAFDASATELKQLAAAVREMREAVGEYRRQISLVVSEN